MFQVTSLRTGKVTQKTEEQVNALKASELFKAGNYSIKEVRSAEPPKEVADSIKKGEKP